MKKNTLKKIMLGAVLATFSTCIWSQNVIVFNASELIPNDTGYYIRGVWLDEEEPYGELEWYGGCDYGTEYYEDYNTGYQHHDESDTSQGFSYVNGMVMHTCTTKYVIEPPLTTGFIQLRPCKYIGTDSAIFGAVITPLIINLEKLYMEISVDVKASLNQQRYDPFIIEYSKDNGINWGPEYIFDDFYTLGGDEAGALRVTYDSADASLASTFLPMVHASQQGPIRLRIRTNDRDADKPYVGQYLNIHVIEITADEYVIPDRVVAIAVEKSLFEVRDHVIIALQGKVTVFNILGQHVGTGKSVTVDEGIYIVKTDNGLTRKVCIK